MIDEQSGSNSNLISEETDVDITEAYYVSFFTFNGFKLQESDFQNMPTILVFPNLAWFCEKLCFCKKETTLERFQQTKLPSVERAIL